MTDRAEPMNEDVALANLYWFYKMVVAGGPDGSDLDEAVRQDAERTAQWWESEIEAEGGWLPEYDKPKYREATP